MQTALHLLTRDGAIHVAFSPHLSSEQYADLMRVLENPATATKDELRKALEEASTRWGIEVEIDD